MRKGKWFLLGFIIIVTIVTVACNPFGSTTSGQNSYLPNTINGILRELPEVRLQLPKSLGGEDSSTGPRSIGRGIGQVSTITKDSLNVIRTDRWRQLQEPDIFVLMVNRFFDRLRQEANSVNFQLNQLYQINITGSDLAAIIPEMSDEFIDWDISGSLRFIITSFSDTFLKINGGFNLDISVVNDYYGNLIFELRAPLTLEYEIQNGSRIVEVYTQATMYQEENGESYEEVYSLKSIVNADTGEVDTIGHSRWADREMLFVTRVKPQGQTVKLINTNGYLETTGYVPNYLTVGYGNNSLGGIGSLDISNDWYYDEEEDDWIESDQMSKYAYREFFNSDGSLLFSQWGDQNNHGSQWFTSIIESTTAFNLKDYGMHIAPVSFSMEFEFDSEDNLNKVTFFSEEFDSIVVEHDFAPTWEWGNWWLTPFFQQSGSDLSSGDALYWAEQGNTTFSEGKTIRTAIYKKTWSVPQQQSAFGEQFFMDTTYPLISLLPLTNSSMTLQQKLIDVYDYTWVDWEGNEVIETWNRYDFWIEKYSSENPQSEFNPEHGDIRLDNLYETEHWVWNPQTSRWDRQKVYEFRTSEATLPSFFTTPVFNVDSIIYQLDLLAVEAMSVDPTGVLQEIESTLAGIYLDTFF